MLKIFLLYLKLFPRLRELILHTGPVNQHMQQKQEAFMALYTPHSRELSNYCRALLPGDDAKDLLGETVLIAFEKFEQVKEPEKFKQYLFGIASRLFRKKLRRKKIIRFTSLQFAQEHVAAGRTDDNASLAVLYRSIYRLKAVQAEIIVLSGISGFTLAEIAGMMQMNLNTVKTNLSRARQQLEKMLEKEMTNPTLTNPDSIATKELKVGTQNT